MHIADLPWYDLPELQAATDAWWCGIAAHLRRLGVERVPEALQRGDDHVARWRHPDLLLSQACGYDVLYDEAPWIVPVATPCYRLPGCEGPRYASVLVVRSDDPCHDVGQLRGRRFVLNEPASHSGNNALRPLVARHCRGGAFFGEVDVSGSHTDSLAAVQDGASDAACVDLVVLELLLRVRPRALHGLRVLARTAATWAPPYVTSTRTEPRVRLLLAAALHAAASDPGLARCRDALLIDHFVALPDGAYRDLVGFEEPALRAGYFELPAPQRSPLHRPPCADGERHAAG